MPLRPRPDAVPPAPEAGAALSNLAPYLAAVAVVSGRPDAAVRRLLGDPSGVEILGSYGLESARATPPPPALLSQVRRAVDPIHGVSVEAKPQTFAVHYRDAPAGTGAFLQEHVGRIARQHGWQTTQGKSVLDVVPQDEGLKATAALRVCRDARATRVAFLGDDVPDLEAVRACRSDGLQVFACFVLDEETPEDLAQEADVLVANPVAMLTMLRRSVAQLRGRAA